MPPQQMPSPDDTPMLTAPTERPDEPITAGLNVGPGPAAQGIDMMAERRSLKRYMPLIQPYLDNPEVPDSVRMLFRAIRSS